MLKWSGYCANPVQAKFGMWNKPASYHCPITGTLE